MSNSRFDLAEIKTSLDDVSSSFKKINKRLSSRRDKLGEQAIDYLISAYELIDGWLAADLDLFALGASPLLLEINTTVLCGRDPQARSEYEYYLKKSEEHFYDSANGDIGGLVEWYELHRKADIFQLAAGLYIQVASHPQLFIEGNHRTAAVIISYVLARRGLPPFVLTKDRAKKFLNLTASVTAYDKNSMLARLSLLEIRRRMARFIEDSLEERHLLADASISTT